ncbi:hypothetical protein EZS27_003245 [termite gut metagenome]|uniref:Uncharacterized protein n=1 Tax=termite gut metagenome TaxID=433724 RepID=A0A5J4ST29_9ZZZZ
MAPCFPLFRKLSQLYHLASLQIEHTDNNVKMRNTIYDKRKEGGARKP